MTHKAYCVFTSKDYKEHEVGSCVVVAASPSRAKTIARKGTYRMCDDDYINMRVVKLNPNDITYMKLDYSEEKFVEYYPTFEEEMNDLRFALDWPY